MGEGDDLTGGTSPGGRTSLGAHQPAYRQLAEMSSDVAMEVGADDRVLWVSPSIRQALGWGPEEFVGHPIFEKMHPDDRDPAAEVRSRVMTGETVRHEIRFLGADGAYRWMSARIAPVHDDDGNVVGRVAGWHDVSAEHHLREQLRAEQEQFRLLAEHASDVVVRVDVDGVLEWVSPSVRTVLGWDPAEMVGRPVTEFVMPTDLSVVRAAQQVAMSGRPIAFDARVRRRDGSHRWMGVSIRPILDANGRMVGRAASWRDIHSEYEKAEQHRRSDALYRMLAENSSDVVLSTEVDGTVLWVSPAIVEVAGWQPDDLIGRKNDHLIHPDDLHLVHAGRQAAARGEASAGSMELRYLTRDGRYLWMSVAARPVLDDLGNVVGRVTSLRNVDAEHRMREELARKEEQYRALAENSSDVVVQSDADGVIRWLSASITEQMGWLPEELVGSTPERLVHPDDLPHFVEGRVQINGGGAAHFEARYRTKAGEYLWFSVAGRPLFGPDGTLRGRVVGLRNIDAEVRARAQLAASEERFRFLVENTNDIVLQLVEGRIVFVSPVVTSVLGWLPEELEGRAIEDFCAPDDRAAIEQLREHRMGTSIQRQGVLRALHKDGTYRWVEASGRTADQPDGRAGAVATIRDVTARLEAEAAFAEMQARDALLASMSSDLFLLLDARGDVLWASGASDRLLGETNDEVVGSNAIDALVGLGVDTIAEWRDALDRGERVSGLAQITRLDGRRVWLDFRAEKAHVDMDERGFAFVSIRDAQAEVDFRERLAASEREAKEANLAKTAFLSRMSHELRTPLNAVLGFAQLLQLDQLTPSQMSATEQIITGGRHLLDLINEVLDISRIESGRMSMSPEAVQASDVIRESLGLVRGLAATHQIDLEGLEPCGCDDLVCVDRQRTIQILLNLLSNAVKYNRAGGGVRVRCVADPTGMLRIEVEDDGMGIAPEYMGRVFEPFDRLGADRTAIEGTGIGLALSRGLAEMMHGRLEVSSTPGVGSVFSLLLPRAKAAQPSNLPADPPDSAQAPSDTTVVLYVEDNPANAMLMRSIVERLDGITLREASTGESAIEWASADPPDLVLLDLHLPDIPGEDVLRRLRTDPRTAVVPVVVVSADAAPDVRQRLAALGADAFLPKPVDVQEVLAWIDQPLRGRGAPR